LAVNIAEIVTFSRNRLQVSGFCFIFALAKQKSTIVARAMMTPEITSGIIYALLSRSAIDLNGHKRHNLSKLHTLAVESTFVWRQGLLAAFPVFKVKFNAKQK